jgi:hypothetical protein
VNNLYEPEDFLTCRISRTCLKKTLWEVYLIWRNSRYVIRVPIFDIPADYFTLTSGTNMMSTNEISCFCPRKLLAHWAKKIAKQVGYLLGDPESFHI